MCKLANRSRTWCKPNELIDINSANSVHTGFVQVPLQLHHSLYLHVVLEEAAAERGLVVGLPRPGLDGSDVRDLLHMWCSFGEKAIVRV